MGPPNRPKTRLPLALSPDGFAYFAAVDIDSAPRKLLVDTSSAAGITLACTSFPADGAAKDACLEKAKSSGLCPPNSAFAYSPLWGTSLCRAQAAPRVELKLADLTLPSVPPSVLTSDTSLLFHGADGALGLALRSTYTTRSVNLTDQIESFSLHLTGKQPYIVLNDANAEAYSADGWTELRQMESFLNESTIDMRGFRESVNESFVTARTTPPTSTEFSTVNAALDAAWPSLIFPADHFNTFHAKYLTSCAPHSETSVYDTPRYYHCDRSVKLPRLAFTTTNGTFFLDRADYIREDPEDAARAIVLVQNFTIRKYAAFEWGLGQPFLRKFPAFFDGTGKRHQMTLYCQSDISCDLSKWVVNGSRESITYPPTTSLPRSGTKSSETHTRYWSLLYTIPVLILLFLYGVRRFYRQHVVDRERRRMLNQPNEQESPQTAAKSTDEARNDTATTPTTALPYSLLSGPTTITVNTNSNDRVAVPTIGMPVATGATARWRNDLSDLETRL